MRDCGKRPAGFGMIQSFTGVKPDFLQNALWAFRAAKIRTGRLFCHHAQDRKNRRNNRIPLDKCRFQPVLSLWPGKIVSGQ